MKVLQINSVCGVGSTGRIATDLYRVLEEQGHECVIAYGRGTTPEGIKSIKIGTDIDNYMHVAKTRIFDKHGFGSEKATKNFIKKIEEYNPDIIHLHNIHGYYINIEILFNYLKKVNKKIIWTLHDCWAFTGHCAYFDYVSCMKWKDGCKECLQIKEYPNSLILDNSQWSYNKKKELFTDIKNLTIITPSNWLANLVKQSFLGNYELKVINNGIDLQLFKQTKSNFREKYKIGDKIILLGVASVWDRRKGINYFIDLSQRLGIEYQVVVVGVSEKQKKALPKEILAITRTNSINELAEIYSAADVFINPTLEEVMGLTNVEALACGTGVITFNTGGSIECIDSKCGIIVEKFDCEDLIKKISEIKKIKNTDCINRAKLFDKNDKYKEYIKLYIK